MWLDRLVLRWWFGHAVLLIAAAVVVGLAVVITPSDDILSFFGVEIPVLCGFRNLFGVPCPGCGLTRSFVFMAHGRPLQGLFMNPIGPVLFSVVLAQIPYRMWRLRKGPTAGVSPRLPPNEASEIAS